MNLNIKNFINKNISLLNFVILSLIFCITMYLVLLKYYVAIVENIVPWGDPFTYEMGYYHLLNLIDNDKYVSALAYIVGSNWYWLQKILLAIFSPILINEPYSLCIINYFTYSVATILLHLLLKNLKFSHYLCWSIPFIIWFFPINYHLNEYSSLPIMGLDSTFLGAIFCLVFSALSFFIKPQSVFNQYLFGIFLSAAIVGRGNSLTVIALVLIFPSLSFLLRIIKEKNYDLLYTLIRPAIFFILSLSIFFAFQLKHILNYYSVFSGFLTNDFSLASMYLKNIPGIFFHYPHQSEINLVKQTSILILLITITVHLLNFFTYFKIRNQNSNIKIVYFTGISIFYLTFLINIFLWMHPHINIYNAQLIWAPIRIGIILVFCALIYCYQNKINLVFQKALVIFMILCPYFISNLYYQYNSEINFKYKVKTNPDKIKRISSFIENNSSDKKSIILWYGPYLNPRILNYYKIKNNQKQINYFRGKYADHIWNQSANSEEFQKLVKKEINDIFENAELIVINNSSKNYVGGYAFYRYNHLITDQLRQGKLDYFQLIAKLDSGTGKGTLLVFKRTDNKNLKNFDIEIVSKNYKIKTSSEIKIF